VNMVGNTLQELRVKHGFSRPQLAKMIGVTWETIKAYEVKGVSPSLEKALKISGIFNTPVNEIFYVKVEPETENIEA
jgi:putative transcriptional regulator